MFVLLALNYFAFHFITPKFDKIIHIVFSILPHIFAQFFFLLIYSHVYLIFFIMFSMATAVYEIKTKI